MAYGSSSRGSSRGSPARGGGGGSRGGGGANNMMGYAVAVVLLAVVVVAVVVMSGKKKDAPKPPPPAPAPAAPVAPTSGGPAPKPYPPVPDSTVSKGRDLVRTFQNDADKASRLYAESLKAKGAGDDTTWQSKLKEARALLENIKDQWNEFVGGLPSNRDWDSEDVAKHYLGRESGQVQTMLKPLAAMKTDER